MNYVITTMHTTSLHKGLSPPSSLIWLHRDALLLSARYLVTYTLSNEMGYQSSSIPKGLEAEFGDGKLLAVKSRENELQKSQKYKVIIQHGWKIWGPEKSGLEWRQSHLSEIMFTNLKAWNNWNLAYI